MQTYVKQRATETGDISFHTPAIDVEGMPLLVTELIVYGINGGGSEQIQAQMMTSSDLVNWTNVTSADVSLNAAGQDLQATQAASSPYGRYVRYAIAITGSVTDLEYSLILNTFASS